MFLKTHRKTTWLALFLVPAICPLVRIKAYATPKPKAAHKENSHKPIRKPLFNAIQKDDLHAVQALLNHGTNVNERDSSGFTPLMAAAESGDVAIVKLLLQKGATVNAKTPAGETALLRAAGFNKIKTVILLLNAGANANVYDSQGATPLSKAVLSNLSTDNTDFVKLLLDHGANPNPDIPPAGLGRLLGSPLVSAANFGEKKIVELLLARGAGAQKSDMTLDMALMATIGSGNMMNVRMSLHGCAITASDEKKATLIAKFNADDTAIVQALFDHGADTSTFPNILTFATSGGVAPIVHLLLDHGAPVNGLDMATAKAFAKTYPQQASGILEMAKENIPPLIGAAGEGYDDICNMLLDAGADPNSKDAEDKTALITLVENGRNKIAHNLPCMREVESGRVDVSSENSTSPGAKTTEAVTWQKWADDGDIAIIKALLAKKANLEMRDNLGNTALMAAAVHSSPAVVQTLIDHRAALNAQNTSGQNALMQVLENGRISRAPQSFAQELQSATLMAYRYNMFSPTAAERAAAAQIKSAAAQQRPHFIQTAANEDIAVVKILLAAGINVNAKDKKGQTALQIARKNHHAAIIALLKQAAAKTGHVGH